MRNEKYVYDNTLTEDALKSYLKYSDTRGKGSDNNTFGGRVVSQKNLTETACESR